MLYGTLVQWLIIMPIIFGCCFNCCVGGCFLQDRLKREQAYKPMSRMLFACLGLCNMIPLISAGIIVYNQQDRLLTRYVSMKKFVDATVNCGDNYTATPPSFIDDIKTAQTASMTSLVLTAIICLTAVMAVCCCVACVKFG